ncbi:MAG: NAD(P)H-dependent oxidoreductase subunit E [Acidobacteriota bacterium]|jgi:NADH-quinone oxidoreductase subunit E|nr:NAD(P)H-dependent oxidoreductase subunit E [Acidobacteriota bacterium]
MDANKSAPQLNVLVIDAGGSFVEECRKALEGEKCEIVVAGSCKEGLLSAETDQPGVVILDLETNDISEFKMLGNLGEIAPDSVPIVVSRNATVNVAVDSMKLGAFDFLVRPVNPKKLLESVRQALNYSAMQREGQSSEQRADKHDLLLEGLDVFGEAYSIGLEKREFLDELGRLESAAQSHAESLGQVKTKEEAIAEIHNDLLDADAIMWKYDFQKNALIQILLDVQEQFRWLPRHILNWISGRLNIPLSDIYVIANFYEAFSLEPRGRHSIQVCTGTACHVRGASELLMKISATLGIEAGQTDSSQEFTLETVNCIGCCALAPVVQIDSQYYRNPSKEQFEKIIKSLKDEEALV